MITRIDIIVYGGMILFLIWFKARMRFNRELAIAKAEYEYARKYRKGIGK